MKWEGFTEMHVTAGRADVDIAGEGRGSDHLHTRLPVGLHMPQRHMRQPLQSNLRKGFDVYSGG